MNIIVKATGERKTAQYITTKSGNKRYSVDGKTYSDKKFDELFAPSEGQEKRLYWKSNVKGLFEEIIECGGPIMKIMDKPLRITYNILREVADRAIELNDPKLNALMCRLALYIQADPYSSEYAGDEAIDKVIDEGMKA